MARARSIALALASSAASARRAPLAAAALGATALEEANELEQCGDAHEEVDDSFHDGPCAEEHSDEIPFHVGIEKHAEADETPVKTADDEEYQQYYFED